MEPQVLSKIIQGLDSMPDQVLNQDVKSNWVHMHAKVSNDILMKYDSDRRLRWNLHVNRLQRKQSFSLHRIPTPVAHESFNSLSGSGGSTVSEMK